jgi:tetratricopeptide (TPR) repeat protein
MSATGSIIDIQNRLLLWANRPEQGLARVEFASEFSRQQVIRSLRQSLTAKNLPFDEIVLPTHQDPELVVSTLIDRLADSMGIVSITGFSTAFSNQMPLPEALRIVNFNRERFLVPGVKQIWWMTPAFMQTSVHAMPDLNRWFSLRLQLTEAISTNQSTEIEPALEYAPASYANMADTHRRVENLLQRFHQAQAAGLPDNELLTNYLLPALESLAEVGAQQELRDLTLQFEGLLGRLKVNDSPEVAISLDRIAGLYYDQGRYSDAEPLYVRALAITEQQLGANHPSTATSLNNLASLYRSIGRYNDAEPLYVRALAISEQQLGANHPSTATSLNNLASLYESISRYSDAEPLYVRALAITEQQIGANHPASAISLNNLAGLYYLIGRYSDAEPLYVRALAIREQQLGVNHPDTGASLNNLAVLYESNSRYNDAKPLYTRALEIKEQQLGADHPSTATSLNNLAGLYESIDRYSDAEPLYVRALAIREQQLGANHPDTGASLNNLAGLYESTGRYSDAEPLYVRAISIWEQQLGEDHPNTKIAKDNLEYLRSIMATASTRYSSSQGR